jgi:hypothetical protein
MPKSPITLMTVGQLKHSTSHMDALYDELRNSVNAPTTLILPFDITKKVRAKALEQRVLYAYGPFKEMKFRSTSGFYNDGIVHRFHFTLRLRYSMMLGPYRETKSI